jgi:hypothetical protein
VVQVSYSDVFSIKLERDFEEEIRAGDTVRTGPNLHPHHLVIAVNGDKAWLRNVQNDQDAVTNVNRCRKIEPAA